MDVKTQKLVELYAKCLANNYNDMSNETQQLKVKVFAMDLGLKYKKIEDLYDEAKTAYEQHQANQERNAILKKKQDEEKALREKMQENATLAFTIESTRSTNTIIDVFRCEDGSVFARERDKSKFPSYRKKENYSNLSISVKSSTISNYQYHPSKTIFTGASSGGIAMGGFHTTEAHYTMNQMKTAKGYIEFGYGESRITIKEVTLAPEIAALYRRNKDFRYNFNSKNTATCHREISDSVFMNAALGTPEFGKQMEMVGHALDAERIPYSDCVQIADILNGIIHNKLPEQDEEIYTKAVKFSQTKDLQHLAEAVNRFEYIKDYKDSEKLLGEIKPIYETLVQESKEREVLRREAASKKKKIITYVVLAFVVVTAITGVIAYNAISKNLRYEKAKASLENRHYQEAIQAFTHLRQYKDSAQLLEQSWEGMYNYALNLIAEKEYEYAHNVLSDLGSYKDSEEINRQLYSEHNIVRDIQKNQRMTKAYAHDAINVLENHKYYKNDYLLERLYMFIIFSQAKWEYVSGDATVCSAFSDNPLEYKTITTDIKPDWWDKPGASLYIKHQKEELIKVGGYNHSTSGYDAETDIAYFTGSSKSYDGQMSVTVENSETLKITIEYNNGTKTECIYKLVK